MSNTYCLVVVLYYETTGKVLECNQCPLKEKCDKREVKNAKS